jgi:hypothetical protein
MSDQLFVPADFVIADGLTAEEFRLEPLGPQYNAADYAAWTASISHIQATPPCRISAHEPATARSAPHPRHPSSARIIDLRLRPERRLSEALHVYAAPDQDVCCVDM